jgi:hypothetical protein
MVASSKKRIRPGTKNPARIRRGWFEVYEQGLVHAPTSHRKWVVVEAVALHKILFMP